VSHESKSSFAKQESSQITVLTMDFEDSEQLKKVILNTLVFNNFLNYSSEQYFEHLL